MKELKPKIVLNVAASLRMTLSNANAMPLRAATATTNKNKPSRPITRSLGSQFVAAILPALIQKPTREINSEGNSISEHTSFGQGILLYIPLPCILQTRGHQ